MKKVMIDENFSKVLGVDPIADVENVFGKHYSDFNNNEKMMLLANAFHTNTKKSEYLKSLGDTHFSMKWNEFLELIRAYGFIEGLHYHFDYKDEIEQAIIYYHPEKGLVIWATSFCNGESVNGGTLYGQVKYTKQPIEYKEVETKWGSSYRDMIMTEELRIAFNSLNGCSHDAFINAESGLSFSYDIREALINKITSIEKHLEFCNPWVKDNFLWFVDFVEDDTENYDYKKITLEKIKRCSKEFQKILQPCIDKLNK